MQSEQIADLLSTAINATYQKSTFPQGRDLQFSPHGSLDSIITATRVGEILTGTGHNSAPQNKGLIEYVLRKATKLFAIVLWIDFRGERLTTTMASFYHNRTCDQDLPVDLEVLETSSKFSVCRSWKDIYKTNFLTSQWMFLAPRFAVEDAVKRLQFHPKIILPFKMVKTDQTPSEGAFGTVWRVKIHPSHFGHQQVRDLTSVFRRSATVVESASSLPQGGLADII